MRAIPGVTMAGALAASGTLLMLAGGGCSTTSRDDPATRTPTVVGTNTRTFTRTRTSTPTPPPFSYTPTPVPCNGSVNCQPTVPPTNPTPTPWSGSGAGVTWGSTQCTEFYNDSCSAQSGYNFFGITYVGGCSSTEDIHCHTTSFNGSAAYFHTCYTGSGSVDMGVVPLTDSSMQSPPSAVGSYLTTVYVYDQHSYFLLSRMGGSGVYVRLQVVCADGVGGSCSYPAFRAIWQLGQ